MKEGKVVIGDVIFNYDDVMVGFKFKIMKLVLGVMVIKDFKLVEKNWNCMVEECFGEVFVV